MLLRRQSRLPPASAVLPSGRLLSLRLSFLSGFIRSAFHPSSLLHADSLRHVPPMHWRHSVSMVRSRDSILQSDASCVAIPGVGAVTIRCHNAIVCCGVPLDAKTTTKTTSSTTWRDLIRAIFAHRNYSMILRLLLYVQIQSPNAAKKHRSRRSDAADVFYVSLPLFQRVDGGGFGFEISSVT